MPIGNWFLVRLSDADDLDIEKQILTSQGMFGIKVGAESSNHDGGGGAFPLIDV